MNELQPLLQQLQSLGTPGIIAAVVIAGVLAWKKLRVKQSPAVPVMTAVIAPKSVEEHGSPAGDAGDSLTAALTAFTAEVNTQREQFRREVVRLTGTSPPT